MVREQVTMLQPPFLIKTGLILLFALIECNFTTLETARAGIFQLLALNSLLVR